MKILIVSLFLPQKKAYHAGGRFVFEAIRHLSEKHEIHLVVRLSKDEIPGLESLRPFCKEIFPYTFSASEKRTVFHNIKLIFNYICFSRYADYIARNGEFHAVQVEWVETALMMKRRKTPMLLDAQDVITKPAERMKIQSTGLRRLFMYARYFGYKTIERRIVNRFQAVFTRSENDKIYLESMNTGLKVTVIPHPAGLDITGREIVRRRNNILFLASYKYRKVNVDAALHFYRNVFPIVRREIPDAKFIIAGYGPPEELRSLQRNDNGVVVTGFVDDIDECYKRAGVFVAPILIGGGIIVKILDALAAGTPVVTTSYGNEGIMAMPGRDLIVADSHEDFADAVIKVLLDEKLAKSLSANGREFVRQNFSRDAVMSKMDSVYQELVK